MSDFSERDIGKILADVEYLKREQAEIKTELKEINKTILVILNTLSEAKGHWKALLLFGSFCAALGGLFAKFIGAIKIW